MHMRENIIVGNKIIIFFLIVGSLLSFIDFIQFFINEYNQHENDIKRNKAEELSKAFEIERSLNEVLNNQRAEINRLKQQISNNSEQDKHMKNNDKQIVYKIEKGDLIGDITGENVTIVLMQGDIKGNVNAGNGEIFLARGNINGDIKADKVVCPQPRSEYQEYIDKLSGVEKLSKPDKEEDEIHCVCANPNTNCAKCAWFDYVSKECKSWDANEGECQFIDKNEIEKRHNDFIKDFKKFVKEPPPDYVCCADCVYAKDYSSNMYKCSKYDGVVVKDSVRICDSFKQKERHTCKSCYHFVKDINGWSYCSKYHLEKLYDSVTYCPSYDGTGETTNYKSDCARFSNNSGRCFSFHVIGCPIKNNCPDKIERKD